MKFRSRNPEESIRIASTSGHICIIGNEFSEVPDHMTADAYAAGCVSEDMYMSIKGDIEKEMRAAAEIDRPAKVDSAIQEMLDSDDKTYFTNAGLPNRKVLNKLAGFSVTNEEFDVAWGKVVTQRGTAVATEKTGATLENL